MQNGLRVMEKGRSNKKSLKLEFYSTIGFSRQFSEDIIILTEIINLVKMIDDNDDVDMESRLLIYQLYVVQKNIFGRLYLNIFSQQELVMGEFVFLFSFLGSFLLGDQKSIYVGVLRRRLFLVQGDIDFSLFEFMIFYIFFGFTIFGIEIDTDLLGIFRNLNINFSVEN